MCSKAAQKFAWLDRWVLVIIWFLPHVAQIFLMQFPVDLLNLFDWNIFFIKCMHSQWSFIFVSIDYHYCLWNYQITVYSYYITLQNIIDQSQSVKNKGNLTWKKHYVYNKRLQTICTFVVSQCFMYQEMCHCFLHVIMYGINGNRLLRYSWRNVYLLF